MNNLKIEYVPIGSINPSEYNPRAISNDALDGLKKSLSEFGLTQPLVVNKRTNTLVGGHQRLRAAAELGFLEIPVVYVDLPEDKEQALNVVLNNKHIEGFFTDELQVVLRDINESLGTDYLEQLRMDLLVNREGWGADLDSLKKIEEDPSDLKAKIVITCSQDDKDHIVIKIKEFLMETSLVGVHIE
jgi:hypothetical protein